MAQDQFLTDLDAAWSASQSTPATPQAAQPAPKSDAQEPTNGATQESKGGVGDFLGDTAKAVAGGVEAAGRGIAQTAVSIDNMMMSHLTGSPQENSIPQETMVANPKYGFNKVVKDITQYGLGFVAGGPVMKGAGIASKGAAAMMAQSAVGTGLVADPHAERLSNLLQQYSFLEKPMSYLAANPDDSVAMGKLKASLEDAFTTPVALGLFKAIHFGIKSSRGLLKGKEAAQSEADLAQTLQQLNEAAESGALKAEKYPQLVTQPDKSLDLFKANPTLKHTGREEVNVRDLHMEHTLDEKGTASAFQYADKYRTGQDVEDLVVKRDAEGKLNVMSGNARTVGAGQAGKEKVFADVFVDNPKNSNKLRELQQQAGGSKQLDKMAAKAEKSAAVFNLTPEQMGEFTTTLTDKIKAMRSDPNIQVENLVTESLPQGAFNYTKMANRADVHFTMQTLADTIAPNLKSISKDYMSFPEMQRTAALFGTKPENMMANLRSWGVDGDKMAPTLLAAKAWSQSLADEIYRDARSIAIMGSGGASAKLEMTRKISVLADIEGMMKSVQTAAARTTAAGRIRTTPRYSGAEMMKLLDEAGGDSAVTKFAEKLAMTEGDPAKVMKLARLNWQHKVLDTHNELWINSLLSGVSTHAVNVGSAAFNTFIKPGNITLGGLIKGDLEQAKQGYATFRALHGFYGDAWSMARKAFDMERPILSVSDKQLEMESTISAGNYGLNPDTWVGQGVNWLGKAVRIPSRFLGAEDEFFKQLNYRARLHRDATMDGLKMVKDGKLDPANLESHIQQKFDEGFDYQVLPEFGPSKMQVQGNNKDALQYANEATFTQSLKVPTWTGNSSFAEDMYRLANSQPLLRGTVLPFVKVPANLLREAASYTPGVAQLRKQFWSDVAAGGDRAAEAYGKMATGSMMLSGATLLAVNGKITGGAPNDADIRNRMYEKGWQPYSFVFDGPNGEKTYVPFSRFDPYGLVFGVVGDIAQTFQHIGEADRHSFAAQATMAVANLLNSRSYLKGMVDALDVLSGGQGQDGIDKFTRIINQRAATYVPNISRLVQPDTEMKEIRSMMDAILAKTPGFSSTVPAKRGYFGDKVMAPVGWPWHAILPAKPSNETSDPALQELARLSDGPAQSHFKGPERRVGTLDLTKFTNANGVTAYDRMMEKLNETDFHDRMNDLVTSDTYKAGTDGDAYYPGSKQVAIKKLETKYHKRALEETLKEFQDQADTLGYDLRSMYQEDRRNARASRQGRDTNEIDRLLELTQ